MNSFATLFLCVMKSQLFCKIVTAVNDFCVLRTGDYMNIDKIYEDITDIGNLKKHMLEMLEEYNSTPGVINMDLVLFRDAIEHG